jgi:hypothetical protein
MLLGRMLERFAERTPICVAVRGLMESALSAEALDGLFRQTADRQYERELLFSTCVDLMSLVVSRTHASLNAVYQASPQDVGVSLKALYDKLAGIEVQTSAMLVRHTASKLAPILREMGGTAPKLLPGLRVKILDGNHLGKTQRRLKPLRDVAAGPLPGQTLAVLDPELGLVVDLVCCEDAHAQERSFANQILVQTQPRDVWIADRNFCTTGILFAIAQRSGKFLIRQHASTLTYSPEESGKSRRAGRSDAGGLQEQTLLLSHPDGRTLPVRRITITLDQPTRDGETQIHLLTTLTSRQASAKRVAALYLSRWKIEHVFQTLTCVLQCEVNTLGYPKAALFAFCVAAATYNIYATVKGALRAVHGAEKVEQTVSDYFLADEIAGTWRGLQVAVEERHWEPFAEADTKGMARFLLDMAARANLSRYKKSPRGPKKTKPRRTRFAKAKHIATARLLANEKQQN